MKGAADICEKALKLGSWVATKGKDYIVWRRYRDEEKLLFGGNEKLVELRRLYDELVQIAWRCINADKLCWSHADFQPSCEVMPGSFSPV